MNILRHKKWHVRTKENVARVRRDEAKAAEEEKARAERAALADHEDRVRRLKARAAAGAGDDIFGRSAAGGKEICGGEGTSGADGGHVNLFAELEEQERKNLVVGNVEHAAEKKREQDDWESKVGIMKRFAEDTKEYAGEREWWEGIPMVRERPKEAEKVGKKKEEEKFRTKEERKAMKRAKKMKKKRRKHHSSSSSSSDSEEEARKKRKLEEMRRERIVRERQEQRRTKQLIEPEVKKEEKVIISQVEQDRQRKYNSQFNPEFAR